MMLRRRTACSRLASARLLQVEAGHHEEHFFQFEDRSLLRETEQGAEVRAPLCQYTLKSEDSHLENKNVRSNENESM